MAYRIPHIATGRKQIWLLVIGFWLLLGLSGCAAIKEAAKGVAGISTKVLEDGRKSAITKSFNYDYPACYAKTQDALKKINAYVYEQGIKKYMIAIYISKEDTTPVGLFFKEIDAANTQVEVSSPSTYAKEFISIKVFSILDKSLHPEEKDKQADTEPKALPQASSTPSN